MIEEVGLYVVRRPFAFAKGFFTDNCVGSSSVSFKSNYLDGQKSAMSNPLSNEIKQEWRKRTPNLLTKPSTLDGLGLRLWMALGLDGLELGWPWACMAFVLDGLELGWPWAWVAFVLDGLGLE